MASTILGLILDSSILIAAERRKLTPAQVIEDVVKRAGAVPVILSPMTIAEVGHGIYRAKTEEIRRESMLNELRQRIREVRQGPDGLLYLLTDEDDGALLRIEPAS